MTRPSTSEPTVQERVHLLEWGQLHGLVGDWEAYASSGILPNGGILRAFVVTHLPNAHPGLGIVTVMLYVYREVSHRQAIALKAARQELERLKPPRPPASERWQT